jgi:methionyl-tRNA synthetase
LKGTKLSNSRGAFVEVPYLLSKYDPDALPFYLTATAPEPGDPSSASGQGLDDEDRALTYDHSSAIGTWAKRSCR